MQQENPDIVFLQEVSIRDLYDKIKKEYRAFFSISKESIDGIGTMTLTRKEYRIYDSMMDKDGRVVAVKLNDLQIWNLYPLSGGAKKERETFFNQTLPHMMAGWDSKTSVTIVGGDLNCTAREIDSERNQNQHYQEGLVQFMKVFDLKDEYVTRHGEENPPIYSRITVNSKTRIDMISSNSDLCKEIEYKETTVKNLDHKAVMAIYEVDIRKEKRGKWNSKRNEKWIIPKELIQDDQFMEGIVDIVDTVDEERKEEITEDLKEEGHNFIKILVKCYNQKRQSLEECRRSE